LGRNLRFDLRFLWNALFVDEKFFVLFSTESGQLPFEVGEEDTLIPNFLVQLSRFLLQSFPGDDFIRDF